MRESEEEEDGESTSESASIDAQLLQTKFASLASALQEEKNEGDTCIGF